MRITSQEIARYRQAESALCDAASEYVGLLMGDFHLQHPNASVAEVRSAAIYAIDDALNAFGTQAGTLACDLFDDICEAEGLRVQSELEDTIDRSKVEEKVRWLAGRIEDIEAAGFDRSIRDLTSFYVKRQTYQNMVNNCKRNGVRYARVPSGRETCSFCFMLSSRGFVYHSRKTAEGDGLHGVHQHCDCIIVPGVEGVTHIDGYDPDAMREKWITCKDAIGGDEYLQKAWDELPVVEQAKYHIKDTSERGVAYSNFCNKMIQREVDLRDWRWLYSDTHSGIEFSDEKVKAAKEKRWKKDDGERITARKLNDLGYRTLFWDDEPTIQNPHGKGRIIKPRADLSTGIELKTLYQASTYNTIDYHVHSSMKKNDMKFVLYDFSDNDAIDDNTAKEHLLRSMVSRGVTYARFLGHSGAVEELRTQQ